VNGIAEPVPALFGTHAFAPATRVPAVSMEKPVENSS
jgi:hypothetical protein